jgi:hypothetical protein
LLHLACCQVTQLLYQPLHIYKIYKINPLKQRSDMFRSQDHHQGPISSLPKSH